MRGINFYIHHFYNYQVIYIISYLIQKSDVQPDILYFDPGTCDNVHNSPGNFLLFSLITLNDLAFLHTTIQTLRTRFIKVKLKIIVGGALLHIINCEQLRMHYPEITYVCLGKGEEIFKYLIESNPREGIYRDKDFPHIKNMRIHQTLLSKLGRIYVTLNDNRCSWNRCTFCHHNTGTYTREKVTVKELGMDMLYYLDNNINHFEFYDNELRAKDLCNLLDFLRNKGVQRKINIFIFGMRVSDDFSGLSTTLGYWQENPVKAVCWGIEFFDQEILDLFQKGIKLDEIINVLSLFHSLHIQNTAYILLGLPRVRNKHIKNLLDFKNNFSHLVNCFRPSFFRLSSATPLWKKPDTYGIKIKGSYQVNDLSTKLMFPDIETIYYRFESWDEDDKSWKNRREIFEKYRKLNCLFNIDQYRVIVNY